MSEPDKPASPPSPPVPGAVTDTPQPPFSEELVADLHAGLLDADRAARLWPAVLADHDAARLLERLDGVQRRLGVLRHPADIGSGSAEPYDSGEGSEPMPELVAARLRRSLLHASDGQSWGVEDDGACRSAASRVRRSDASRVEAAAQRRSLRRRRGLITAAAAAAIAVGIAAPALWSAEGDGGADADVAVAASADGAPVSPQPDADRRGGMLPGSVDRPMVGHRGELDSAEILSFRGNDGRGPFTDPSRLATCLAANGLPAHAPLLGSGPVHVDGRDNTLLLIPGPHAPMLTALIVTPGCGHDGGPGLVARTEVGN